MFFALELEKVVLFSMGFTGVPQMSLLGTFNSGDLVGIAGNPALRRMAISALRGLEPGQGLSACLRVGARARRALCNTRALPAQGGSRLRKR